MSNPFETLKAMKIMIQERDAEIAKLRAELAAAEALNTEAMRGAVVVDGELSRLRKENELMYTALEEYADPDNWEVRDYPESDIFTKTRATYGRTIAEKALKKVTK